MSGAAAARGQPISPYSSLPVRKSPPLRMIIRTSSALDARGKASNAAKNARSSSLRRSSYRSRSQASAVSKFSR
jgi:hypothetical protein